MATAKLTAAISIAVSEAQIEILDKLATILTDKQLMSDDIAAVFEHVKDEHKPDPKKATKKAKKAPTAYNVAISTIMAELKGTVPGNLLMKTAVAEYQKRKKQGNIVENTTKLPVSDESEDDEIPVKESDSEDDIPIKPAEVKKPAGRGGFAGKGKAKK